MTRRELEEAVASALRKLARIEAAVGNGLVWQGVIWRQGRKTMAKIDDLLAAVSDEKAAIATLATAVQNGTVDPAKLDAAIQGVKDNTAAITALASTVSPPAPPPPPDTPPA